METSADDVKRPSSAMRWNSKKKFDEDHASKSIINLKLKTEDDEEVWKVLVASLVPSSWISHRFAEEEAHKSLHLNDL